MAAGTRAHLYLDGKCVGEVAVRSQSTSWSFGEFQPGEAFVDFAGLFGTWSMMMHVDDDQKHLSRAAAKELRDAERAIDQLDAQLFWPENQEWLKLLQVNIDGQLIEWKHGGPGGKHRPRPKPMG